jgi:hypothetical protein
MSKVVQSAEEPLAPTCNEVPLVKVPEAATVVHKSSIASLPTSWLPFKKRKLSMVFSLEVPNCNFSALEKTPEKGIAKPSLHPKSSASGTPPEEGKTSIGFAQKDKATQDDVQAIEILKFRL